MSTIDFTLKDHLIHDIKAPIQRIKALSNISETSVSQKINQCTEYLEQIVNAYLGVHNKTLDSSIKTIITNKVELFPTIKFSTTFTSKIDQLALINIDAFSLNRVLYNLIQNAVEATNKAKAKQPHIQIKTYSSNKDFYITISDNGCGFPPHVLKGLKTHSSHKGRGIGLSAVRSILKDSAGDMTLSNDRFGAKITLRIPLIFKGASEIVLYEDDPMISCYVEKKFKNNDYPISLNPDQLPKKGSVILMDVKLKNDCGLKKAKYIKKQQNCQIYLFTNFSKDNFKDARFIDGIIDKSTFTL